MKDIKMFIIALLLVLLLPISVKATAETDTLMKKLAPDLENATFKMKKPTSIDDGWYSTTVYVNSVINTEDYEVYADCDNTFTTCTIVFYGVAEYDINVTFDEPKENAVIDGYLDDMVEFEMGNSATFHIIEDLSLINYYLTGNKSELWNPGAPARAIKFSDLNKITKGSNITFYMVVGMGTENANLMYENAIGEMGLFYNGYMYAKLQDEIYLKRVIYIPEDIEESTDAYIEAAQERINEYLGNNSVTVALGGSLEELNATVQQQEQQACLEYDDPEYCILDEMPGAEDEDLPIESDGNYYLVTIGERTYKFYIVKGTEEQLKAPVYNGLDLETNIEISSTDSSIPLDSALTVTDVDDNTIGGKIGTPNYVAYDITVHSAAKDADITELENGKFLVRIPIPEELQDKDELTVWYIPSTGDPEEHKVTPKVINDIAYVEFETTHFSTYALAEAVEEPEEEPKFNVTYDFNGGTNKDNKGKLETEQAAVGLDITKANFIDEMGVTPPEGYELDAIEINGTRTELGGDYLLNKDTVFKYLWKSVSEEDNPDVPGNGDEPTPKTGDNIINYFVLFTISLFAFTCALVYKFEFNK